jgi:hypothetical protein
MISGCPLQDYSGLPTANSKVFKVGRTSTWTAGYYSALKSAHVADKKVALEHSITGARGNPFSSLGDYGSLAFNQECGLAGLIVAGSNEHPVTYITLAPDLFDDIKNRTGAKDVRVMPTP